LPETEQAGGIRTAARAEHPGLVIVERVELETGAGFSVLTGETGAGKSSWWMR
jgi:hypothetical protein